MSSRHKGKKKQAAEQEYLFGVHAIEAMLKHFPERIMGLFALARTSSGRDAQIQSQQQSHRLEALIDLAQTQGISCQEISLQKIEAKVGAVSHQGVIAAYRPNSPRGQAELIERASQPGDFKLLVLDGVTDPHNFGACIRTADALGMDGIAVAKDHSAPLNATVRKVASGAAECLPIYQVTNLARMLAELKECFVQLVGASCTPTATPLHQVTFEEKFAIVMGSEGKGLRALTEKHCDQLAYVHMHGYVNSLNVSVATGVFIYEAVRNRQKSAQC